MLTAMTADDLAAKVRARRQELGLNQSDLAKRGVPGHKTVGDVEAGNSRKLKAETLAKFDATLDWASGMADEVLSAIGPPPTAQYDIAALVIDAYRRGLEDGRAERRGGSSGGVT